MVGPRILDPGVKVRILPRQHSGMKYRFLAIKAINKPKNTVRTLVGVLRYW